ncbi:interleukin-1 receptor type 1-like isoform X2 [Lepisosteus oculatus]
MGLLLLFALLASCLYVHPFISEENCTDYFVDFERYYSLKEEPVMLKCSLQHLANGHNTTYTISWYKNETRQEFSGEGGRIRAQGIRLWFLPSVLADTGHYVCILRTPEWCKKQATFLIVNETKKGDCNNIAKSGQKLSALANGVLSCPETNIFMNEETDYEFLWYKDCVHLVEGDKYTYDSNKLFIQNVSSADKGNYTCRITFSLNGTTYTASRTIDPDIIEEWHLRPKVTYPINNTVGVAVGSAFSTNCTVFLGGKGKHSADVLWIDDQSLIPEDSSARVFQGRQNETQVKGGALIQTPLMFSEVKEEDLNRNFTCYVVSAKGSAAASFVLQPHDLSLIVRIGCTLTALTFVLVIIVVTYKIFKMDIVLWFRGSFHHLYRQTDSDGKVYDAYIIYPKLYNSTTSTSAETFTLQALPHVLERQCGYKLFIFGRDGLPGEAVVDVTENIKKSRRLIIIYTSTTFGDTDSNVYFEQQSGMHSALIEGTVQAILIELEDVKNYSDFPESIRYLKQKQGAIRWKGGSSNISFSPFARFWKQVRYHMPVKHSPSCTEKTILLNL